MRVVTVHNERDPHTSILAFVYIKEACTVTSSMCKLIIYLSVTVSLSELGSAIIQAVELVADKESSNFAIINSLAILWQTTSSNSGLCIAIVNFFNTVTDHLP